MFVNPNYKYHGCGKWIDKKSGVFWRSDKRNQSYFCHHKLDEFVDLFNSTGKFVTIWGYRTKTDEEKNLEQPYAGFYVDLDCNDIDEVYVATKKIYNYFKDIYKMNTNQLHVIFSGNKGFHIELDPIACGIRKGRTDLPFFYRWYAKLLERRLQLRPGLIDFKVYEPKRLWRCERTIHESSGLWCHRISEEVFANLDATLQFCIKDHVYDRFTPTTRMNPMATSLWDAEYVNWKTAKTEEHAKPTLRKQNIDPNRLPYCVVSCLSNEVPDGEWNNTLYAVARALYSIYGIDQDEIEALLLNWMVEMPTADKHKTIRSAVQSTIPFSCFGMTLMGELLHKGIAKCPYKTNVEKLAFCDVYAGKPLSGYKNIGKAELGEYIDQLYAALDTNRVRADWQQVRIIMQKILQYEEKWVKEWEDSVK